MTLWAFFSDIHGNLPALERAIGLARERGAERVAFLGDLLGRGDPDGVVELVRRMADLAVVGNRDLDWAERVSPASRAYVLGLPRRVEAARFVAVHGDPKLDRELNIADVRRGAPRVYRCLRSLERPVLLFGHTHHARVWRKRSLEEAIELVDSPRSKIDLEDAQTIHVINVGTTGLPFPGKGPASFALLEDEPGQAFVEMVLVPPG